MRAKLEGRGPVDTTAVTGIEDRRTNQVRAKFVPDSKSETLSPFKMEHTEPGAKVYTDDASAYDALPNRESVNHSRREYARGDVHTNGVESFRSMLKRANVGTFHKSSPEHLHRYVADFAGGHNLRELDTLAQMIELGACAAEINLLRKRRIGPYSCDFSANRTTMHLKIVKICPRFSTFSLRSFLRRRLLVRRMEDKRLRYKGVVA
ncbi:MAG: IS1595 family transposase [Candidatus Aminicenantes bacterium]|nr:IS1595 family transposase [Candidatus Aminicenantes bacterium]